MRTAFSALAILLFLPLFASANALKDDMQTLGILFRDLSASLPDRAQNSKNAERTAKIQALLKSVRHQTPDSITNLPPSQKETALRDYLRLMDQEIAFCSQLRQALLNDDNKTAGDLQKEMNLAKREGHNKYKY